MEFYSDILVIFAPPAHIWGRRGRLTSLLMSYSIAYVEEEEDKLYANLSSLYNYNIINQLMDTWEKNYGNV